MWAQQFAAADYWLVAPSTPRFVYFCVTYPRMQLRGLSQLVIAKLGYGIDRTKSKEGYMEFGLQVSL